MTSATLTAPADGVTVARVLRSEWIKFRTLRSSWYTLGGAVAVMVLFGAIFGYTTSTEDWATVGAADKVGSASLNGYQVAHLVVGVLAALFVTGEYATGMIRSTFAAVPRRPWVIAAKTVVASGVVVTALTAASFGAFFAAQAFLAADGHAASLADPGVLRAVAGTSVYLALIGVLGGALGWILRSTAGAISALVAMVLVLPALVELLPSGIGDAVAKFLPSEAGGAFLSALPADDALGPWTGLGVLVLWAAAALAFATYRVRGRDA